MQRLSMKGFGFISLGCILLVRSAAGCLPPSGRRPDLRLPERLRNKILNNLDFSMLEVRDALGQGGPAKRTISLSADFSLAVEEDPAGGKELTISEWLEAWSTVAYVLGSAVPKRYPELLAYQKVIANIAQKTDWNRAKLYDREFQLNRNRAGSHEEADILFPWSKRDDGVFADTEPRKQGAGPMMRAFTPLFSPQNAGGNMRKPKGFGFGPCRTWNATGSCEWGSSCRRPHVCILCRDVHPQMICRTPPPVAGVPGPRFGGGAAPMGQPKGSRSAGVP